MKRTTRLITAALICATLAFAACKDEKEVVKAIFTGYATAYSDAESYLSSITDDFGHRYSIADRISTSIPNGLFRVVVSAEMNRDSSLNIIQIVKPITFMATEESKMADSLKVRDPINIVGAYIGGGYLNITLQIKTQQEKAPHMLDYSHIKKHGKHTINIYHNAYQAKPIYSRNSYLSIPLGSYGLNKNDTVSISYMSFDGDRVLKVVYN